MKKIKSILAVVRIGSNYFIPKLILAVGLYKLNFKPGVLRLAPSWFLEIDLIHNICVCAYVSALKANNN